MKALVFLLLISVSTFACKHSVFEKEEKKPNASSSTEAPPPEIPTPVTPSPTPTEVTTPLDGDSAKYPNRFQCEEGDLAYNCKLVEPQLTSTVESSYQLWEVSYNFACTSGKVPSKIRVNAGDVVESEVLTYASTGTVFVNGYGPLKLTDKDPKCTSALMHNPGCALYITEIKNTPKFKE